MKEECEILTATEASRAFSEMLHRVCYGGESFLIKKGSRIMARIVPVEVAAQEEIAAPESENLKMVPVVAPVEKTADAMTQDESEFYQAWMEQVRKVPLLVD